MAVRETAPARPPAAASLAKRRASPSIGLRGAAAKFFFFLVKEKVF